MADQPRLHIQARQRRSFAGVSPSPLSCLKLALHQGMIEKNLKKTDLARLLACHMPQIDRLLDLNHESRFERLERALAAIGRYQPVDKVICQQRDPHVMPVYDGQKQ